MYLREANLKVTTTWRGTARYIDAPEEVLRAQKIHDRTAQNCVTAFEFSGKKTKLYFYPAIQRILLDK